MPQRYACIPRTMSFIFYSDEVLLIKASSKKDWVGIYDPVGGHIERGEDIIESAKREIYEETGLQVTDTRLAGIIHTTGFYGKDIMLFVTVSHCHDKQVISSDEGELEWVKIEKLDTLPIFKDLSIILKKVLELRQGQVFIGTSRFNEQNELESINLSS